MVTTKAFRLFPANENGTPEQFQAREANIAGLKLKAKEIWGPNPPDDNILRDEMITIDGKKVKAITRYWPNLEIATRWCEWMRANDEALISIDIEPQ